MLHTVHMFCKLGYHYYSAVFKVLQQLSEEYGVKFYREEDRSYHCYLLHENGILLILRRNAPEGEISYNALEIIMNPMRLLNGDDYLSLSGMKDNHSFYKEFKKVFQPIKKKFEKRKRNRNFTFKLDQLDSYSFKRVDFAVNIYTKHIKHYIQLSRRAYIPDGCHLYKKYSESSKRFEPPEDSFYIIKKGKSNQATLTIQCYDKGQQLKENNLPFDERAEYTIRFEVQCRYNKVYRIIKSKGLSKQGYSQFLREDISMDVLHTYFKKTIGYGDYYSLSRARDIIQDKKVKAETKRSLVEILERVNAKRGIWKAREAVSDKKWFDKGVKQLHGLGINPATIPLAWGVDYLPCLFELIE